MNDGSASAAKIIAGALQDHDRAVVVGTPTFGKGLVQTLFPLGEGVALKLTTARWYTPSGRTIQRTAKDEEAQAEQAAPRPATWSPASPIRSTPTPHPDPADLPYQWQGGRGRGGIVPDLVIRLDTLSIVRRSSPRPWATTCRTIVM